jgi:hypothetical protein
VRTGGTGFAGFGSSATGTGLRSIEANAFETFAACCAEFAARCKAASA